jgi:hypothetical protein
MLRLFFLAAAVIGCVWFSGCDFPEIKRPVSGVGGVDIDPGTTMSGGQDNADSTTTQTPTADPPATPPADNRTVAQVGAGSKGHLDPQGRISIYSAPVNAYFRTRENLTYNVQIPHAMDLYKAEHGRAPQSHDEFWRVIIQANHLKMPELREGYDYEYDPQTEDIYVVPRNTTL